MSNQASLVENLFNLSSLKLELHPNLALMRPGRHTFGDVVPPTKHHFAFSEQFQAGIVHAIASSIGASISEVRPDTGRVDWNIMDNRFPGLVIQIQGKTSQDSIPENSAWTYDLDVETYNELARPMDSNCVRILVVHYIPPSARDWISHDEAEYKLRNMGYWAWMTGAPPSQNATSKSVQLKKSDVFGPDTLRLLFSSLQEGRNQR